MGGLGEKIKLKNWILFGLKVNKRICEMIYRNWDIFEIGNLEMILFCNFKKKMKIFFKDLEDKELKLKL